jgi:TonB family protein
MRATLLVFAVAIAALAAVVLSGRDVGAQTITTSDFPFAWYLRQVQLKIAARWEDDARAGSQPHVFFEIGRDGEMRGLLVEKSSGDPLYDAAAVRVIIEASPFPPLPEGFKDAFLRVRLSFTSPRARVPKPEP